MGLPPLLDTWTQALLGASPPEEKSATCDDCAMCPQKADASTGSLRYDPRTKCCTYTPHLHNYLVGRILREQDPAMAFGKRVVAERVAAGVAVTPLGLGPAPERKLLYNVGGRLVFGKTLELRCPYYVEERGGCGVWRHRDVVCSTYFCKYDRGDVGHKFWRALQAMLTIVSEQLAFHCALEVGLDDVSIGHLPTTTSTFGDTPVDPRELDGERVADYAARWGRWDGREREFFIACAEIVDHMAWPDVLAAAGARARVALAELNTAYAALRSEELPSALRIGAVRSRPGNPGTVCLAGYHDGDEIAAPSVLADLLPYFDGSPVGEVLARIEQEAGIALERDLVRKLVDFKILVAAAPSG